MKFVVPIVLSLLATLIAVMLTLFITKVVLHPDEPMEEELPEVTPV
jgi:hypothetical protein